MLGLFELPEEEVPPEEIWHHGERLDEWFEAVKQARKDRMQGTGFDVPEADDPPGMASNEEAAALRESLRH